ncbi:MAG: glutathione S-transferase family protein [Rhizobiales bacterium]|nr:glutathione S-transferase family protein [Hyphomicrobiales bacterium]
MTIKLYDLSGDDGRRFSPYCWRTKMALAHKGLEFETLPTMFVEIGNLADNNRTSVPVIEDDDVCIQDSFEIALYLEETYPDGPSLFGGQGGQSAARFIEAWTFAALHPHIVKMIIADIHNCLNPADHDYFRETREKMLGAPLEEIQAARDERLKPFHRAMQPLRAMLAKQPFIGGDSPQFADYIVFGSLQWPRVASAFDLMPPADDPVSQWFERCLDLHDGLGRSMIAAT